LTNPKQPAAEPAARRPERPSKRRPERPSKRRPERTLQMEGPLFELRDFEGSVGRLGAVVLAGGTMQPIGDLVAQLFADTTPLSRVTTFSCGHIVPRDALACYTVASGPTGVPFNFRHGARSGPALMTELGRALLSAAAVVPAGLVTLARRSAGGTLPCRHAAAAPSAALTAKARAASAGTPIRMAAVSIASMNRHA
jgi:hypothetical protein